MTLNLTRNLDVILGLVWTICGLLDASAGQRKPG
jgi:hypothetical protein